MESVGDRELFVFYVLVGKGLGDRTHRFPLTRNHYATRSVDSRNTHPRQRRLIGRDPLFDLFYACQNRQHLTASGQRLHQPPPLCNQRQSIF